MRAAPKPVTSEGLTDGTLMEANPIKSDESGPPSRQSDCGDTRGAAKGVVRSSSVSWSDARSRQPPGGSRPSNPWSDARPRQPPGDSRPSNRTETPSMLMLEPSQRERLRSRSVDLRTLMHALCVPELSTSAYSRVCQECGGWPGCVHSVSKVVSTSSSLQPCRMSRRRRARPLSHVMTSSAADGSMVLNLSQNGCECVLTFLFPPSTLFLGLFWLNYWFCKSWNCWSGTVIIGIIGCMIL